VHLDLAAFPVVEGEAWAERLLEEALQESGKS
jgi:hypothetical protein